MAFVAFEPFARTAAIAHKDVGLLFIMPRVNGHDLLFVILVASGRLVAAFPEATTYAQLSDKREFPNRESRY